METKRVLSHVRTWQLAYISSKSGKKSESTRVSLEKVVGDEHPVERVLVRRGDGGGRESTFFDLFAHLFRFELLDGE